MTLITVICNDLIIFSRSKSRIFENSTLSPCGYFMEIPARKNKFVFLLRPFYVRLNFASKNNLSDSSGTNVLSSAKTRLPRILTETL